MNQIVRTDQLTKIYKGKEVVSNVNITINQGEIYGFLGPNGAGKTTIMKMITNLVKPSSGKIELFKKTLANKSYEVMGKIGAIIEQPIFYERLSARGNLQLHCDYMGYHNNQAIDKTLELVHLIDIENKPVREFSIGMKQRLAIARAIIARPELLILDEPINGLDPVGIKEMRKLFKQLNREYGITIFISSHILAEIEHVADKIGVINNGRLIEEIEMDKVREKNKDYIELVTENPTIAASVLEHQLNITNFKVMNQQTIRIYDLKVPQGEISKVLFLHGVIIESIYHKSSSLEDYFFTLLHGGGKSA